MSHPELITEEYRSLQVELHRTSEYGSASVEYAPMVGQLMRALGTHELLDYGAGKGRLAHRLEELYDEPFTIHHYEPAVPQWAEPPQPCPLVACIDVLEHIEPELIDNVLDDLKRVTQRIGFFAITTLPAVKVLADGRNAHLIQQPASWWLPKLLQRFELNNFTRVSHGFWVVVEKKPE